MALKTVKASAPIYWASYLINGDASGISDDDRALADRFVEYLGAAPCDVGESYFAGYCDAPGVTLAGDMAEYTALVEAGQDPIDLDTFLDAYIECALWSSTDNSRDDGGDPLDDNYGPDDIAPETLAEMRRDCADFIDANTLDLNAANKDASQHGHDFWLTRNGHGAGFWDRGYGEIGERLSKAARVYGSVDLYIDDAGKVRA